MSTTIKGAIREEQRKLRERREATARKLAEIDERLAKVEAAAAALNGAAPPATTGESGRRRRSLGPRKTRGERRSQVEALIRHHYPEDDVSAALLRSEHEIPHASATIALDDLREAGRVRVVGKTSRGKAVYRYVPFKIRPGEEVKS